MAHFFRRGAYIRQTVLKIYFLHFTMVSRRENLFLVLASDMILLTLHLTFGQWTSDCIARLSPGNICCVHRQSRLGITLSQNSSSRKRSSRQIHVLVDEQRK